MPRESYSISFDPETQPDASRVDHPDSGKNFICRHKELVITIALTGALVAGVFAGKIRPTSADNSGVDNINISSAEGRDMSNVPPLRINVPEDSPLEVELQVSPGSIRIDDKTIPVLNIIPRLTTQEVIAILSSSIEFHLPDGDVITTDHIYFDSQGAITGYFLSEDGSQKISVTVTMPESELLHRMKANSVENLIRG